MKFLLSWGNGCYLCLSSSTRSYLLVSTWCSVSFHWWRAMWINSLEKLLLLHATSTNNLTSSCWFIDNASQLDTWECKECAESFQSVRLCHSHRCFCQRCGSSLSFFLQFSTSRQIKFCKHYTKSNAFTSRTNIGTKEEMKFRQPHGTCNLTSVPPRYFERWISYLGLRE